MNAPERKTLRLRYGRTSLAGSRYFLTLCTRHRTSVLLEAENARRIASTMNALQSTNDIDLIAATVMPDHVHLLFTLGERLTLGQTMAKLKNLARDSGRVPWRWLDDGFEHRLRAEESAEDYAFYIFMNPYRARLVSMTEAWPWWQCPDHWQFRFMQHLDSNGLPPSEWLDTIEETAKRIVAGE